MLKLGTLMENDHYIMILLFITIQCNTYSHLTTILHKRKKDKDNLINPKPYIYSGTWLLRPPKRLVSSGLNSKVV